MRDKPLDKLHEECAVFGVSLKTPEAVGVTYNGLLSLQHRGQEGAGIAVVSGGVIVCRKELGLVSEVFSGDKVKTIPPSCVAVGHARYSTTGGNCKENVGPFITEFLTGRIATAHNGNITNAMELRKMLQGFGLRFAATSDSEVVSSLIAYRIIKEKNQLRGITKALGELKGAFSLCIATADGQLVAVRDSHGLRPLCIGKSQNGLAVSSESCALDATGFELFCDVQPGEAVLIEAGRITKRFRISEARSPELGLCIFEYVYFSRSDSVIDGLSVYEARHNMGAILAEEHPAVADIVCGVPDSGLDAACGYADASGLPLTTGFVKNRYVGRTFIYPTQVQRASAVRIKLNPLSANIKGKRVVLVDDSIVRGTTIANIIKGLKTAGAKEVHLRISSPPFKFTCRYGTDVDSVENLIANKFSIEEICKQIGADSLGYISIEGLKKACAKSKGTFCSACFTGEGDHDNVSKNALEGGAQ